MVCCQKSAALINVYEDESYSRRPDQRVDFCQSPLLISYFAASLNMSYLLPPIQAQIPFDIFINGLGDETEFSASFQMI